MKTSSLLFRVLSALVSSPTGPVSGDSDPSSCSLCLEKGPLVLPGVSPHVALGSWDMGFLLRYGLLNKVGRACAPVYPLLATGPAALSWFGQ